MRAWGMHGVAHWWRVRHNGLQLATATGADEVVVRLFAIFHDSHRHDEHRDPAHGPRAAEWLVRVRDGSDSSCPATTEAIERLGSARFEALRAACELHTSAATHADPTVATCFAADRLDLWRVGTRPNPKHIPIAREILTDRVISEAISRSETGLRWDQSGEIGRVWRIDPDAGRGASRDPRPH